MKASSTFVRNETRHMTRKVSSRPDCGKDKSGNSSPVAAPTTGSKGAIGLLSEKFEAGNAATVKRPDRATFAQFLTQDARVPTGGGTYGPYSFEGREAIEEIVEVIDHVLAERLQDASVAIAGGAQWGKTILELNLAAYCTSQPFLNFGLFLPDNDLVAGVIDTKFRPDVVDQVPWFAEMVKVGKAVNASGKAVDRKGAFIVTDGQRRANGMAIGLQKIPTTFTLDVAALDEVDDIPERNAKFVKGRLTSSKLRFTLRIGTQRIHGRGQQKAWADGSQGVIELSGINPEEAFPGIIRCAVSGSPRQDDPKLTWAGDFRRDGSPEVVATHSFEAVYYLAHPETGAPLDRTAPVFRHRRPERVKERAWSFRVSQLGIGAISLGQIVGQFQLAVNDPEEMTVFRCDVLALPQSTTQALTPSIIARAQSVEPFNLRLASQDGRPVYGGLDTGDRCYLTVRERESAARKRLIYATTFPAGDLVKRGVSLFHQLGLTCLFIDQRPLVSEARSLALALNGLDTLARWPRDPGALKEVHVGKLHFDGTRWRGLRCAVVRFDKKQLGAGIEHGLDIFEEGGQEKFVPLIRCNRFETIDRAVRELLTPDEAVVDVVEGRVRELPSLLLPAPGRVMEEVAAHFITGSERAKEKDGTAGDYVDQTANHYLLANGYAALAEQVEGGGRRVTTSLHTVKGADRRHATRRVL